MHSHYTNCETEGNQIGISSHGMMFVTPNPTQAQREQVCEHKHAYTHENTHTCTHPPTHTHTQIDAEYGALNWSLFGPASDEANGLKFLESHEVVLCDDAKQVGTRGLVSTTSNDPDKPTAISQTVFHTKSVFGGTIDKYLAARPWIKRTGRVSGLQSDNAPNYRDYHILDLRMVGDHCFNEGGEGKNEGDKEWANTKAGVLRLRNSSNMGQKYHQECADDYLYCCNIVNVSGTFTQQPRTKTRTHARARTLL